MFYSKKICQDIDSFIDDKNKMDDISERIFIKKKVKSAQGHLKKVIIQLTTG